jgi:succinate dehydrogenase / fumarate reductase, membrane anchor subunit
MSYRSPLGRVLGLGNHSGVHHWWVQRVSSVALLLLTIWLLSWLLTQDLSYLGLHAALKSPSQWVPLLLYVLLGLYHSWLGLRVVIEDYMHGKLAKLVTLLVVELIHLGLAATGLFALLKLVVETPI